MTLCILRLLDLGKILTDSLHSEHDWIYFLLYVGPWYLLWRVGKRPVAYAGAVAFGVTLAVAIVERLAGGRKWRGLNGSVYLGLRAGVFLLLSMIGLEQVHVIVTRQSLSTAGTDERKSPAST